MMQWHDPNEKLPLEREYVFTFHRDERGDVNGPFFGYLRHWSDGPFFVVYKPGGWEGEAWPVLWAEAGLGKSDVGEARKRLQEPRQRRVSVQPEVDDA